MAKPWFIFVRLHFGAKLLVSSEQNNKYINKYFPINAILDKCVKIMIQVKLKTMCQTRLQVVLFESCSVLTSTKVSYDELWLTNAPFSELTPSQSLLVSLCIHICFFFCAWSYFM